MNELAQQFRDAAARLDRFDTGKATAGLLDAEQKSPDAVAEGRQAGEALGMPAPIADLAPEEAAKRARIKQYRQALADCTAAVQIDDAYTKAYLRRGIAHRRLGQWLQRVVLSHLLKANQYHSIR